MHIPENRILDFGGPCLVMGIINATPDSFYPGSRAGAVSQALDVAGRMIEDGADIIDIGGESTRPGSDFVEESAEKDRVIPVIQGIRKFSKVPISIDTRKAEVARAALDAGADIINDISALRDDPEMGRLTAERGCPVVLMHIRGTPKTMQENPDFSDPVAEVASELQDRAKAAIEAGIAAERIILDPGIGFGKRTGDNLSLLRHVEDLKSLGYPVLIGLSRKSFIDKVLGVPVEERLVGSLAAEAFTIIGGADIIRVHDVRESVHLVKMLAAIQSA